MPDQFEKMYKVPNPKYSFDIAIFVSKFKIELFVCNSYTPFKNPQRWMGQNTFPILLLDDDNMIGEH